MAHSEALKMRTCLRESLSPCLDPLGMALELLISCCLRQGIGALHVNCIHIPAAVVVSCLG